ncbi:MAG: hypothetical protein IPP19_01150 [Verrucomicrobia bacterium]|nr:hypothetical protein [Verrucomicrobiota bacterium]
MRTPTSILASFLLLGCVAVGNIHAAEAGGNKVTYTRLADDVKGFEKLGVVHGKAQKAFGNQEKLREKAIAEAQAEAAKLGATTILITVDQFAPTPLNNVTVEAVAYGPGKGSTAVAKEEKPEEKKEAVTPTDPAKIETTRLADDVKGKTKLGIVHGKAMKSFGNQDKLREKAIAEAKAEAAKLGATMILITLDNFENTPLNNVAIEAIAFK